jgi:hypothetical protein
MVGQIYNRCIFSQLEYPYSYQVFKSFFMVHSHGHYYLSHVNLVFHSSMNFPIVRLYCLFGMASDCLDTKVGVIIS